MNQDAKKLVLSLETIAQLQPAADADPVRGTGHTQPTTTVNTIHTGCC